MSLIHCNFQCTLACLVLNQLYPHLGASPDGFCQCDCTDCSDPHSTGIIEIKCPFSIRDGKVSDMLKRKGSFMNDIGLIQSHRYYTQVQGQLEITQKPLCDFVVWTPNDLFVQRIYKDTRFIETLLKKLNTFYIDNMLPEMLTHRLLNPSTTTPGISSQPLHHSN